tara:strand:- start:228 stop:605 length:378 start_codon:yes stop_codon:yes gene_type:complete
MSQLNCKYCLNKHDGWVRVPDGYGCVEWQHCVCMPTDPIIQRNFEMTETNWEVEVEGTTVRKIIVSANSDYEARIKAQIDMQGLIGAESTKVLSSEHLPEHDGQPTWEQEWQDFGEVYDDEPTHI